MRKTHVSREPVAHSPLQNFPVSIGSAVGRHANRYYDQAQAGIPRKLISGWVTHPRSRGRPQQCYGHTLANHLKDADIDKRTWHEHAQGHKAWRHAIWAYCSFVWVFSLYIQLSLIALREYCSSSSSSSSSSSNRTTRTHRESVFDLQRHFHVMFWLDSYLRTVSHKSHIRNTSGTNQGESTHQGTGTLRRYDCMDSGCSISQNNWKELVRLVHFVSFNLRCNMYVPSRWPLRATLLPQRWRHNLNQDRKLP